MRNIIEVKGKKITAGPGSWAFVAEALVVEQEGSSEKEVFVTAQDYDGFTEYTVSEKSMYAFLTGADEAEEEETEQEPVKVAEGYDEFGNPHVMDGETPEQFRVRYEKWIHESHDDQNTGGTVYDFIEEYSKLTDTKKSAYAGVFAMLRKVVNTMEKGA